MTGPPSLSVSAFIERERRAEQVPCRLVPGLGHPFSSAFPRPAFASALGAFVAGLAKRLGLLAGHRRLYQRSIAALGRRLP